MVSVAAILVVATGVARVEDPNRRQWIGAGVEREYDDMVAHAYVGQRDLAVTVGVADGEDRRRVHVHDHRAVLGLTLRVR